MEKYKIIDTIVDGTYGTVYKGVDTKTNEYVAIKKMKKKQEGGEISPQQLKKKPSVPQKKKPLVPQRNKQPELTGERRAVRDSILANRYNDESVLDMMPGRVTKTGKWSPDRTQYPYKSKR